MAVECPAPQCDYAGFLDAVEGHIGGAVDSAHEGLAVADLRESLHGEASEGLRKGLLAAGIIALIGLWWLSWDGRTSEDQPAEGLEADGECYA
jgi:hypothetical protein